MIDIQVDDRESRSAVLGALSQHPDVQIQLKRLPAGDYLVDERLLFERKTLIDLTHSIKDGRLFSQATRLVSAPQRSAIILEGTSRDLGDSQMRREAIQGALISLSLFFGIPLLRALDSAETAQLMLMAAKQSHCFTNMVHVRKGYRPRAKARLQNHILQGFPGIGPSRAKRLLDHFGTIEAIILAAPDEIARIPGIGEQTVAAMQWVIREPLL